MSNNLDRKVDFGDSKFEAVYDFVVAFSMLIDGVGLDRSSSFYLQLLDLCNAAWDYLPDTITIFLGE